MVPSVPWLLLAVSLAAQDLPIQTPPPPDAALRFDAQIVPFGEAYQFGDITAVFAAVNRSTHPVRLVGLHAITKGGTIVADPPDVVPPGGRLTIRVRQPVGNRLGKTAFRFRVDTDDAGGPGMKLSASGFVQSAYDPEHIRVEFGLVDRARGAQLETEVSTREADRLEVTAVEGVPDWLALERAVDATAVAPTLKLKLTVRAGAAPLGVFYGVAVVRTNVASQQALEVAFRGIVDGDIVPSEHGFDFQTLDRSQHVEQSIRLRRRGGGAPPRVLRVEGLPALATWVTHECVSDPSCTSLALSMTGAETGLLKRTLAVYVEGEADPLPLSLGALVVAPGTDVRSVPMDASVEPEQESAITPARAPAFGASTPPQSPPPPSRVLETRLKWTAAAEDRLYGYVVYRAEERSGPYRRVSRDIVKVQDDATGPHRYEFVDRAVQAGRTYYYYLDVITVGGRKVTFSGVLARAIAADAKAP